jgi:hypothetical protein
MGAMKKGFHFLGVDFQVNTQENKAVKNAVNAAAVKEKRETNKINEVNEFKKIHSLNTIGLALSQNAQEKNHEPVVSVVLHARSAHRALDKVQALRENTVNPVQMQRYLSRWASWWTQATGSLKSEIISFWVCFAESCQYNFAWLGSGLLLGFLRTSPKLK